MLGEDGESQFRGSVGMQGEVSVVLRGGGVVGGRGRLRNGLGHWPCVCELDTENMSEGHSSLSFPPCAPEASSVCEDVTVHTLVANCS